MTYFDIIGYSASILVAISLTMSNVLRLRIINTAGAFTFAVYGYLAGAYPVLAVNSWILLIDIYYLFQMTKRKDFFKLLEGTRSDSPYLTNFLNFYKADIAKFFPDFDSDRIKGSEILFILRNLVPAGIFIFRKDPDKKTIFIDLDYTIPDYRDMKNTSFLLFDKKDLFKKNGFEIYQTVSSVGSHIKYLKKLGFELKDKEKNLYERKI